jgi:two-component sensor histidine kinase/HAMP domain-containing protein
MVLFGLAVIVFVNTTLSNKLTVELNKRGVSIAGHLADESAAGILAEDTIALEGLVTRYVKAEEDIDYAFVIGRNGGVLAHTFSDGIPTDLREANVALSGKQYSIRTLTSETGNIFDIAMPVPNGGAGQVRLGVTDETVRKVVADITGIVVLLTVIIVLLEAIVAYVIASAITRPLSELQAAAAAIGDGDFGGTVDIRAKDEVGRLAVAFNTMAGKLRRSRTEAEEASGEMIREISEHRRVEDTLRANEKLLQTVIDGVDEPIMIIGADHYIRLMNRAAFDNCKDVTEPMLCHRVLHHSDMPCPKPLCPLERARETGGTVTVEHEHFERNDEKRFCEILATPLWADDGTFEGIIESNRDITERRRMEEDLKHSLDGKDLLIKEIHHRVKNNLMIISSLLRLQARRVSDGEARGALEESQDRVRTISMIHERLYQSKDLARVDVSDYIKALVEQLFSSYDVSSSKVKLSINVSDISLDTDTMVPCGLILNELVSNSLKHAFPGDMEGEMHIDMCSHNDSTYTMSVRDTGVGTPDGFDILDTDSLGMQIVESLTRQLEGTVEVGSEGGAEFRITFRDQHYCGDDL